MTTPSLNLTIERLPLDRVLPYERNARTHSETQVAQIAGSIAEFGFVNPVLIDQHGILIAGHGRMMAARKLGLTEVPVVRLEHLTDAQRRALTLADNRIAEAAGWDEKLLAEELARLSDEDFKLDLLGFDDAELKDLLGDDAETVTAGNADADEVPDAPAKPVSRPGDVWTLGTHRLICGDAADSGVIAALMQNERAPLCFTSPPYSDQRDYVTGGIRNWDALMQGVFAVLPMSDDGQVLVNLGLVHRDNEWQPYWGGWLDWMRAQTWRRFGLYVWDQGPGLPGDWNGRLAPAFELVFHFCRKARQPNKIVPCIYAGRDTHLRGDGTSAGGMRNKDGSKTTWNHVGTVTQDFRIPDSVIRIMRHKGKIGQDIDHPAVFPVALPEFVLQSYSDEGDIVFEPFCGSGTTILAAQRTGRQARAVELAPEYVDVAVKRFQQNFPEVPVTLAASDQSFDEVAAARDAEAAP
jgi:DNA modification methylase